MGIGPIPDLRPVPDDPTASAVRELPAVNRVENSSRSGRYAAGRRQPGERPAPDSVRLSDGAVLEEPIPESEGQPDGNINFFA